MLAGYWLLSDLDGTLIQTPHKAQGQYLPISRSPCCLPIQRWLENGGNVCIVTTADTRVLQQVYLPLRKYLKPAVSATASFSSSSSTPAGGTLLFSLYTGAVLYYCTAESVEMVPGYVTSLHCATKESAELTRAYNVKMPRAMVLKDETQTTSTSPEGEEQVCVRGTCIDRATCATLQTRVTQLYEEYVHDVLHGDPEVLKGLRRLSNRYKNMWKRLLIYLNDLYVFNEGQHWAQSSAEATAAAPPPPTTPSSTAKSAAAGKEDPFAILYKGASDSPKSVTWKMNYIRSRADFLVAVGILRAEYVESCYDEHSSVLSSSGGDSSAAAGAAQVVSHIVSTLTSGLRPDVAAKMAAQTRSFAQFMVKTLGVEASALQKRLAPAPPSQADVSQVILLGIPLALFSRYFSKSFPDFVRGGVNAMPQPNSVVFSKMGVSKSTALRYLLGKGRIIRWNGVTAAGDGTAATGPDPVSFAATVQSSRAIALGDNPHTTDYELTVFPDVTFISIEKVNQRAERHRRIMRRIERTKAIEARGEKPLLPNGRPAPSSAALEASTHRSGPMMDDRLSNNILFVGGEEDGTAELLTALMNDLHVPATAPAKPTTQPAAPVPLEDFRQAVVAAQKAANAKMQKVPLQSKY